MFINKARICCLGVNVKCKHQNENINFSFRDIKEIVRYQTPPVMENRWPWLPWGTYNYSKVKLENGKEILITCFLYEQFSLPIDEAKIRTVKVLFPNIKRD